VTRDGTRIGTLGVARGALVDEHGELYPDDRGWSLTWRIGADDRWRMPERETAVRQTLVDDAPVVQTAMRVPGGDAVLRHYGVAHAGGTLVAAISNDSPAPFVAAIVVRGARAVMHEGGVVTIDRGPGLVVPRAPSRWSIAVGGTTDVEVCGGAARTGDFPPVRDRAGRVEAAFLLPVPHRTTMVTAVAPARAGEVDVRALSAPDAAARGWAATVGRGMRIDVPDERMASTVRAALAQILLAVAAGRADGATVAALEDWGFDAEAAEGWRRLRGRDRRQAASRPARPPTLAELTTLRAHATTPAGLGGIAASLLLCVRALLAHEAPDGTLTLLGELPDEWRGQPVDVHDAPTRRGPVSYAVRWHGARPALLWSAPAGTPVRAPALDPDWSTEEPEGEVLLAGSAA
jgi:hypothetical protein